LLVGEIYKKDVFERDLIVLNYNYEVLLSNRLMFVEAIDDILTC